jgi:tetratricopeptide (TPR) repeat protein
MIDRLSAQTRERLRERPADVAAGRGVADVTTGNLAAYEHYFKSRQALDLYEPDRARKELEAALQIDPQFALAHYQRAVLDAWTPVWIKASQTGDETSRRTMQEHLVTAMKMADRLPEKERLALLGWKATVEGRPEEAQRLRDQAAEAYPQDKEAVFWAGDVRFHEAKYDEAIPYFDRALKLDPDYVLALNHLAICYETMGMAEQQLQASRRWSDIAHSPESYRSAGRALLSLDRRDEAEQEFRRAFQLDGKYQPPPALAYWLMYQGRPHDAEAMARDALRSLEKRPAGEAELPGNDMSSELVSDLRLLVHALGQQGRLRDAQAVVDGASQAGVKPADVAMMRLGFATGTRSAAQIQEAAAEAERAGLMKSAKPLMSVAISLALVGDLAGAAGFVERARSAPDWMELEPMQHQLYEALAAWRTGRLDEAESLLRRFSDGRAVRGRYVGLSILGEIQIARGQDAAGAASLEKARAIRWSSHNDVRAWLDPSSLFLLASAYERLGEREKALERVDALLRNWERADRDLPRLAEARALKKRLAPKTAHATQR